MTEVMLIPNGKSHLRLVNFEVGQKLSGEKLPKCTGIGRFKISIFLGYNLGSFSYY